MTTTRLVTVLKVTTAVSVACALAALLWPTRLQVTPVAPALAAVGAPDTQLVAGDTLTGEMIVDANIFSPSRQRPESRTVAREGVAVAEPVDEMGFAVDDTVSADAMAADGVAERTEDAVPRLYGVVDGVAGPQALLRLERARPGATLYREGDRAGGYRVRRIDADRVALDGPRGGLVLRLMPRRSTP